MNSECNNQKNVCDIVIRTPEQNKKKGFRRDINKKTSNKKDEI